MKRLSFTNRMALSMMALALFCSLFAGILFYQVSVRTYERNLGDKLTAAAGAAALTVDPELHAQVHTTDDMSGTPYAEIQSVLQKVLESTNATYIYTLGKVDGKVVYVVDGDTEEPAEVGEDFGDMDEAVTSAFNGQVAYSKAFSTDKWGTFKSAYAPIRDPSGAVMAVLGIDMSAEQIMADKKALLGYVGGAVLASILLAWLLALWVAKRLSRPLKGMAQTLDEIAAHGGDLTQSIPVHTHDDIGSLAAAVNRIIGHNRNMVIEIRQVTGSIDTVAAHIRQAAKQNRTAMDQMAASSGRVSSGASSAAQQVTSAAELMAEVSQALEQVAANTNETATTFISSTSLAQQGREAVTEAVGQMKQVQASIEELQTAITLLGDRSEKIGRVVGMIASIAKQTNLLALNAAIEAARAGEDGRGFNVVAQEVRRLAEQSSQATTEIGSMIEEIGQEIQRAVDAMAISDKQIKEQNEVISATGNSLEAIVALFDTASSRIQEISAATEQQSATHDQILSIMQGVNQIAQEASQATGVMLAAATDQVKEAHSLTQVVDDLNDKAGSLRELVAQFKVE